MRWREILSRFTGFSTAVAGVQWNPSKAEVTVARTVLTFLEDRRVLWALSEHENPEHAVRSVLEIRAFLTNQISELGEKAKLSLHLRAMRAACRKFLAAVEAEDRAAERFAFHHGHYASWVFHSALGELRGVFGVQVAEIAAAHRLSVEEGLASILPALDVDSEDPEKGRRAS